MLFSAEKAAEGTRLSACMLAGTAATANSNKHCWHRFRAKQHPTTTTLSVVDVHDESGKCISL